MTVCDLDSLDLEIMLSAGTTVDYLPVLAKTRSHDSSA